MKSLLSLLLIPLALLTLNPAVAAVSAENSERLAAVLAAQPAERKERYGARHPQQTLEFFGITPGMTVVEVLPGRGWYSPILVQYLGTEGQLIGADYPMELWSSFPFANEDFMAQRAAWIEQWPVTALEWQGENGGASAQATRLGSIPAYLFETVDAVLFVRAMHNLSRFESRGGFRSMALVDTYRLLKPGGVVGVVQHQAPPGRDDQWADGSRGYLNKSTVIRQFKSIGFEFVGESEVNTNPKDVPGMDDIVWRLPPGLQTSGEDMKMRARYQAIGESSRMTLLFRKPALATSR
jgi:predicted methyltransferase